METLRDTITNISRSYVYINPLLAERSDQLVESSAIRWKSFLIWDILMDLMSLALIIWEKAVRV